MPAELSAHWRAHSSRALADPGGLDDALSIHGLQPREVGGRVLLFHVHHLLVELHLVLVYLQLPAQDPAGAEELVLVGPALRSRQPVQHLRGAVGGDLLRLHEHFACGRPDDHHDDDVYHADDVAILVLHEGGLAPDELGGELLEGLRGALAEGGHVHAQAPQVEPQGVLAQADGRPHQGGHGLGALGLQLHLLGLRLGIRVPLEELRVTVRVGGLPVGEGGQADCGELACVAADDRALHDLLAVDGHHVGIRGGLDFLLVPVDPGQIELDAVGLYLQHFLEHPLRRLPGVLVRLLLGAREAHGGALPPVGELLRGLDEHASVRARAHSDRRVQPQRHDVHHPHQLLVLGGVEHEARGAAVHLRGQLLHGLGLALAEDGGVDPVLRQHLREDLRLAGLLLDVLLVVLQVRLQVEEPRLRDPLLVPPLVDDLDAYSVDHGELLVLLRGDGVVPPHGRCRLRVLPLDLVLLVQPVDQLLPPLLDAFVGGVDPHVLGRA
mmetsp:Transcript_76304/g.202435  ORF Transcript_76304/g.202435 Transcript_76304/m.202435 type:complete len:496 (+) Transcript_76304:321-1808(+)